MQREKSNNKKEKNIEARCKIFIMQYSSAVDLQNEC